MTTESAPADQTGRRPRDMVLSLAVILGILAVLALVLNLVRGGDQAAVVDPGPAIAQARGAAAFPVLPPGGLGNGWRTVSAVFGAADAGSTLRIGYLTPTGDGVQFIQSSVPAEQLLSGELGERAEARGPREINGRSWQLYSGRFDETAYVLLEPDRTTIVLGAAVDEELRELAGAIR